EAVLHALEEVPARLVEVVGIDRRIGDNRLIALLLGIKNAQGIASQPLHTFRGKLVAMARKVLDQHRAIVVAAFGITERVDLKLSAMPNADTAQEFRAGSYHFDIAQRLLDAEELDPGLMELPHPTSLGTLVSEHRAGIEEFQRQILR